MKKQCSTCKETKEITEFNKNSSKKDGYQYSCKICQAAKTKKHYEKTKDVYVLNAKNRKCKIKKWLKNYKSKLKCNRCGENHPSCLQFHHINPEDKEIEICSAITNGWSIKRIKKEIDKCEVLCANCHFKHHYTEV